MAVDTVKNLLVGVSVNMIFRPNGENTLMSDYADPVKEPVMFKILRFLGNLNAGENFSVHTEVLQSHLLQ